MSLTEALRAGAPQAFGALYDEYAGTLYAYCHVMVGDEAGDALRDAFVAVARDPGAVPGDDAELPVWLHSLARTECVRRGALARGVVTTRSADPLRHVLALLSPEHREVLALSNALDPPGIARVLGVTRDAAETLVREAQLRLAQAAASVGEQETQDPAMLALLDGAALHRLVTLGHEPPARQRERVLSACAAAGRAPGAAASGATAAFDAGGRPLPPDAFSAQADDATHRFPAISPDEPVTAPLSRVEGISAGAPPDRPAPAGPASHEPASHEPASRAAGPAESAPAGLRPAGGEPVGEGLEADTGEQPHAQALHARPRKPFPGRRLVPAVVLAACAAAVAGGVLAWPHVHHARGTSASVQQSVPPDRTARPTLSRDPTSTPSLMLRSGASPTPTGTTPAERPSPAPSKRPALTARPAEPARPSHPHPTKPKPHHTTTPRDTPDDGQWTTGPRRPGRTCHGTSEPASRCTPPHPWHSAPKPWW